MMNYSQLILMILTIFNFEIGHVYADTKESRNFKELLTVERLTEIMTKQSPAISGPTVRMANGVEVTANGLRQAIGPFVEKRPVEVEELLQALSDSRVEVRWGASLTLYAITRSEVQFYYREKVGSSSHKEGVKRWRDAVQEWKERQHKVTV